jgi:hypothetical protein
MIECICIDEKNKPKEIPESKWIKEGEKYHITYTCFVLPQNELAFLLYEVELTDNELPYEYYLAKRFGITQDNVPKLLEMIENCNGTNFSMEQLLEQTQVIEEF